MIAEDIRLSQVMAQAVSRHAELQLMTQELSITTFRYVPRNLRAKLRESEVELHLDALNRELVDRLQRGGETFVSNSRTDGHYVLRACIVNFHTTQTDVEAVPDIVARIGREVEAELRPTNSQPDRRRCLMDPILLKGYSQGIRFYKERWPVITGRFMLSATKELHVGLWLLACGRLTRVNPLPSFC